MSLIVGIGGASKNTAAALCDTGRILAVCEQERITRTRRAALQPRQLPLEALDTILGLANRVKGDVSCYAVAESTIELPPDVRTERFEHHHGHAATSFYTSPFRDAVVLVCDSQGDSEVTVWEGHERELERRDFAWIGPGFATVYSRAAEALGYVSATREHELETLAHAGRRGGDAVDGLIAYRDDRLEVSPHLAALVAARIDANGDERALPHAADVACGIQRRLGDLLVEAVSRVKQVVGGRNLCLGGGLFFNSALCTRVAHSGLYERTFVPVNPG